MSKKKMNGDGIYFTGKASDEVTGSQYLVQFGNHKCLLECGLHQSSSNDYLDSYKINSEKFKFKPSELEFVFVAHPHIDHCGLIPRLVKEGFCGKIIATRKTAEIMKPLLLNSCYIVNEESRILSRKYKRNYNPLYEEADVYQALEMISVYDEYHTIYQLADGISFQWLQNSHCLGAAQLQLILTDKRKTKKILYTSDIGSLSPKNHYLGVTEKPNMFNDVTIMESTYGSASRETRKTRDFDVEHLRVAINTTLDRGGTVLLPCFSFSKTQEILTTLFDIYGHDETFKTDVIVDSKLSCEICNCYTRLLDGTDFEKWDSVMRWKNVRLISEKEDSQDCLADKSPKIVISSSGFCTNGRIVNYLKKHLKDRRSMIIFSGYTGDNPSYLSYRIKNYRDHQFISINKEQVANKADCITLSTFSTHAGFSDLVEYGSSLNTNKLVLVHGDIKSKKCLEENLKTEISENDKTYRVVCANRGMFIRL